MNKNKNIAVFLDRDGTINEDVSYLSNVADLRILPNAAQAIKKINQTGLKAIIVTNQSGIARGYLNEKILNDIHDSLKGLLAQSGAKLDGIYFCPHHPEECCACRKPETAMIKAAASDFDIDLSRSFMIGDKTSDIYLGHKAGLITILTLTGSGRETLEEMEKKGEKADYVARDLLEAVEWIIMNIGNKERYVESAI